MEPKQKVFINIPHDLMGGANRELLQRRSNVDDMTQDGDMTQIVAKAPIAEMFGFASAIRSATQGRALWTTEFAGFEKLPGDLQGKITSEVRTRKGLKPEPPTELKDQILQILQSKLKFQTQNSNEIQI
jgi:elongation factor 2